MPKALLRIANKGGLPMDVAYQELTEMAPGLFTDDLTHPGFMLTRMYKYETIILRNQTGAPISIYTFDRPLIRRLEVFREKYPELCRLDRADKEGSKSYLLEKSRLSLRLIVPMSDDRKAER